MTKEKTLTPVEQKEVDFYGDELSAVRMQNGRIYVSIRHMCAALGVDRRGQVRQIKKHDILNEGYTRGGLKSPPSADGRGGGIQQASLLRVDLVPLWLSGLTLSRIKEEMRPKLERLQRESATVLWEAFQEGRLTIDPSFEELMSQDTPEVRAVRMAEAVLQLARNHLLIRTELDDHTKRLEAIEAQLGDPGRMITPDQASQISQAVKTVAMTISKASGTNQYGAVYGELYRKFGITSYKMLPATRFEEAMSFLTDWHQSIVGDEPF